MTPADRRFIEYWEDQRKGSRAGYYVTYSIGWGVVIFFVLFFLSKLFTDLWKTGGPYLAVIFIALALLSAMVITHFTWTGNEKKRHRLIERDPENLN